MYHSSELTALTQAIAIIDNARINVAGLHFPWNTLYKAGEHLQAQVSALFAEETNG